MNFPEELKKKTEEIETVLKRYMPKPEGYQKTVLEAMDYSVLAGGKRLRPMLMQETYRLFGGSTAAVEPFMAAMELIHTYSLVHDDLPDMDNDEYRRGRKTTHAVFGPGMAILAGDALLNYAFETAAMSLTKQEEEGTPVEVWLVRKAKAIQILAFKSGVYGMAGGQTADIESAGKALEEDKLDFIYRLKTGALIEASMMIGAVLAGASETEVSQVEQIAGKVGMAFQIQDDILDLTSTTEELGKPVLSDEKNNKTTYVTIKGLAQAKTDVERISKEAVSQLEQLSGSNEFLHELLYQLIGRKK